MTALLTHVLMEVYVRIKSMHLHVSVKLGLQELHVMSVSIPVKWKLYTVFHSWWGKIKILSFYLLWPEFTVTFPFYFLPLLQTLHQMNSESSNFQFPPKSFNTMLMHLQVGLSYVSTTGCPGKSRPQQMLRPHINSVLKKNHILK